MGDWGDGQAGQKKVAGATWAITSPGRMETSPPCCRRATILKCRCMARMIRHGRTCSRKCTIRSGSTSPSISPWAITITTRRNISSNSLTPGNIPSRDGKQPGCWYRVDLPVKEPLVTILMLDSDHDNLSAAEWNQQKEFLEQELVKPRAAWTVCWPLHHPLFSNGVAADNGILQTRLGQGVSEIWRRHLSVRPRAQLATFGNRRLEPLFVIAGGGAAHSHPLIRDNRGAVLAGGVWVCPFRFHAGRRHGPLHWRQWPAGACVPAQQGGRGESAHDHAVRCGIARPSRRSRGCTTGSLSGDAAGEVTWPFEVRKSEVGCQRRT